MKIYKHEGKGHWIGSTVIVVSNDRETAEAMIRENLDRGGRKNEELNVVEISIEHTALIHYDNGDY
jgi:hypothetical protein